MTGQQGQKRKYNRYGLKRMAELLKGIDKTDMRAKRTNLADSGWSVQFASGFAYCPTQSGWNDHRGEPIWDPEWITVAELGCQSETLEIWPTFRERICAQTTLAQAAIGDIIDSNGVNTAGAASGSTHQTLYGSKAKKPPRSARTVPDELASIKQEETILLTGFEQGWAPIDLTMESPPGTLVQGDLNEGAAEPLPRTNGIESNHIDLTVDEVVDLTVQTVIDITDDDPSEEIPAASAPPAQESGELAQMDNSDIDPLFDGPEPEPELVPKRRVRFAAMEVESEAQHTRSGTRSQETRNPLPALPTNVTPGSGRPTIKNGRKRALDFIEDREIVECPRKVVVYEQTGCPRTLLTAVNGKVVERRPDGTGRLFDPSASSGSALAAKLAVVRGSNQMGRLEMPLEVYILQQPVTNPDELEDYEDEEDVAVKPPRVSSPDRELQAMQEKWGRVLMQKTPKDRKDPIAKILQSGSSLPAPSVFAPPLFLLRISHTRTLRLMARNCTAPHTEFFTVTVAEKAKRKGDALPHDQQQPLTAAGFHPKYERNKIHLLTLLPLYHHLAWVASLNKQEALNVKIEAAIRRNDLPDFRRFEKELKKEVESSWRLGEKEQTRVRPRIGDIAKAEDILFTQFCEGLAVKIEDALMRRPGSYAELVSHQHGHIGPSREDKEDYVQLAALLEEEKKFLVIQCPLVDQEVNGNPHTLVIFASRSRAMGELCGLDEDRMKARKSLVVVHLGWRLAAVEANTEGCLPIFAMGSEGRMEG